MTNYSKVQLISYGAVTSAITQVLDDNSQNYVRDAEIRANTLCSVAGWVENHLSGDLGGDDTLKVLVAPEFYFRYGGPSRDADTLRSSYPNGDQILANLMGGTFKPFFEQDRFTDWLVIGGSMFWHRSGESDHDLLFNTTLAMKGGRYGGLLPQEEADNGDPLKIPTMGWASTNQKQLMSNIDYSMSQDRRDWDAAINPMYKPVLGDWEWWRWHMFNVHGVEKCDGTPLTFGLEVRLEHAAHLNSEGQPERGGVLRTLEHDWEQRLHDRNPQERAPDVDVALVTSCGMSLLPATGVTARMDGLAMLCDGMQPPQGAPWPKSACARITGIDPGGRRQISAIPRSGGPKEVPDELQLGSREQHDPKDTVAVWEPHVI